MGDLTTIEAGALPAHLAGFATEANSDLSQGVSQGFPILSYKGKVWHVVEGDARGLIADQATGEPVPSIEVVVLKANPHIGKTYYPNGYEEGSSERPICYSNDSVAPAADSPEPQSKKCAICPHNQFGSKITENGARGKACSDFRRLAVAPSGDLERAMLLRVPAASLKELVAYAEMLNKKNVPYQALVTRVGFDHTVAYPKLSFKMVRWLDADEVGVVREMMESDLVATITAVNAISPEVPDDDDIGPPPAHAQTVAQAEAAAPAPAAAPAKTRTKAAVTPAEVAAAVEPAAPKATGFGGSTAKVSTPKAAPAAVAQVEPADSPEPQGGVTVLAAGAMSELDAALGAFDDE